MLKGVSLHELHRVEITVTAFSEVKHRGDVRVAHARSRPGLPNKALASRFVTDQLSVDDLERDRISKINIERFIGDTHRPATELHRSSVFALKNLVMLESKLRACRMTIRLERDVQRTN